MRHCDLRVRADVQRDDRLGGIPAIGGEQHGNVIGADKSGDVRWKIDQRAGSNL